MRIDKVTGENLRNNFAHLTKSKTVLKLAAEMIDTIEEVRPELARLRAIEGERRRSDDADRSMREGFESERVLQNKVIEGLNRQARRMRQLVDYQAEDIRRMSQAGSHGAGSGLMPLDWYR